MLCQYLDRVQRAVNILLEQQLVADAVALTAQVGDEMFGRHVRQALQSEALNSLTWSRSTSASQ